MRNRIAIVVLLFAVVSIEAKEPKKYEVRKLAEGVHAFVWTDPLEDPIESNSLFIINDEDVIVVDSALMPSTARVIVSEIRKLTSKPVRLLINTHWHDDHILANSVFRDAWPGIAFVAHRNTRADALELAWGAIPRVTKEYNETVERLKTGLATGKAPDGKTLDPERRKRWEEFLPMIEGWLVESKEIRPTPPDLLFDDVLIIHRGDRIIEVRHPGRGNTRGDAIVWLPKERILATGDLVVNPIPFGIGSYYREWVTTLDALLALPAETIFLSHGLPQKDAEFVLTVRGLVDALVTRVAEEVRKGSTLEDVKKNVTLADWKTKMAGDDPAKQRAFDAFFVQPAVERAWLQARGDPKGEDPGRLE